MDVENPQVSGINRTTQTSRITFTLSTHIVNLNTPVHTSWYYKRTNCQLASAAHLLLYPHTCCNIRNMIVTIIDIRHCTPLIGLISLLNTPTSLQQAQLRLACCCNQDTLTSVLGATCTLSYLSVLL